MACAKTVMSVKIHVFRQHTTPQPCAALGVSYGRVTEVDIMYQNATIVWLRPTNVGVIEAQT